MCASSSLVSDRKLQYDDDTLEWARMAPMMFSWKAVKQASKDQDNVLLLSPYMVDERLKKHLKTEVQLPEDEKLDLVLKLDSNVWQKNAHKESEPFETQVGAFSDLDDDILASPCALFLHLFTTDLIEMLVRNTNAYANHKVRWKASTFVE